MSRAEPNSEASAWDYSWAPAPNLVMINLGTNDLRTDNDPDAATFLATHVEMLEEIRDKYPNAHILCTSGPLLSGADLDRVREGIAGAMAARVQAGDTNVSAFELSSNNPNPGCDWRPSLATHEAMAEELKPAISQALGW